MIISVEKFKEFFPGVTESESAIEAKLQALELLIRKYTNNNFQNRGIRFICPVIAEKLLLTTDMLKVGDTVQISESIYSNGVYAIREISDGFVLLERALLDESRVMVTKVEYPVDVVMGVVNMMKWDLENRDKVGIQSETVSRHSVTYFNMDGDNSSMGYPKSLLGFLRPYMKARF